MRLSFLTLLLIFQFAFLQIAKAQITQTIRGRVTDATTNTALNGASLQVVDSRNRTMLSKTISNTEGVFRFDKLPVGRYELLVSFVGYEVASLPELLLESGKELVLDISLNSLTINIQGVTITGQSSRDISPINGVRNERLSRYPATFNDPARLITYLPGAASDNDGTNNMSVRGSTPNMNQWYLEGAEIVNPNHLPNAGTPSDKATVNGGGVLIPAFNVMESMQFSKGAMSADMGGVLTSAMDIRLRKGNDERYETQVSLGLVGLELGTEGAFSKKSKASYLIHYRYSTIGLLSKLGVPLGDEATQFQDLNVNLTFPTKNLGTFNLFGMYGASENVFTHLANHSDWKIDKDSQDISFTNKMGAIGLRHELRFGEKVRFSTVASYSTLENERTAIGYGLNIVPVVVQASKNVPTKLFLKSVLSCVINAQNILKIGIMARKDNFDYTESFKNSILNYTNIANTASLWLQPLVEWQGKFGENWTTAAGTRLVNWFNIVNDKRETWFEPMANVQYRFLNSSAIRLGYSLQSQMVSPQLSIPTSWLSMGYAQYEDITKSHNFNLSYNFKLTPNLSANIEGYYQYIFDASTLTLNQYEGAKDGSQLATGRNTGVEIDIQQQLIKGFHWRANASFYDAKQKPNNSNSWTDTRFNGHYITNFLIGKEWVLGGLKNRFFGINAHAILRGGFIDVYTNQKLKDYFRTDLNIYWKKSRTHYSSTIQLDLQNVTNQQNEGWRYYDFHQSRVLTKYQLGLIPNLAYKVEF